MKLVGVVLALLTGTASAGDSSWLVCKGVATVGRQSMYIAANLLEHRDGADGRVLEVTLIKGAHLHSGSYKGSGDSVYRKTKLEIVDGKRTFFTGTGELPMDMKTFTLDGKIDSSFDAADKPTLEKVHAKLACELLDDLAIGH